MESISVQPFSRPLAGRVTLPGSKSLTNRALMLAALSVQPVKLAGALFSRDTRIMSTCLRQLGIPVEANEQETSLTVRGCGGQIPVAEATLHVGNAGTAARFMTAFAALHPQGRFHFDGDPAMRERPMQGLLQALEDQGAHFEFHGQTWHFPFTMVTAGLKGGEQVLQASASSQILSALLMAAPYAAEPMQLRCDNVRPAFVEMTCALMQQWGVVSRTTENEWFVPNNRSFQPPADRVTIEADATAASYFLGLAYAHGGRLSLPGLHGGRLLQGDVAFAQLMEESFGLQLTKGDHCWLLQASPPRLEPTPCSASVAKRYFMGTFSDTFLTLAALAPLLPEPICIHGIAHTRKQETDRIRAMANELQKLGQTVQEQDDSLTIFPDFQALKEKARQGVSIETYDDHRVAMSFGVLGTVDVLGDGTPWLTINDPLTCGKTYPDFFSVLQQLTATSNRQGGADFKVIAVDGGAASGKSSTSRAVAEICHFMHVDTGAHYRAVTAAALQQAIEPREDELMLRFLASLKLGTVVQGHSALITLNGKIPEGSELRTAAVNAAVSDYAALPMVRSAVKSYQRLQAKVAQDHGFTGLIMDGRDIGTVIFPDAHLKIYLTADAAKRAARRADEGQADSIANRDNRDSNRATAPLQVADDARVIDNSNIPLAGVVQQVIDLTFP
ncbi:MAG: 3-phosphoshikimate 1-carboxyvinyltransferase [Verrucomicrobia bacterium]|nr:3-phosphoshikimate 1-carboxyvinyltransferase [Verrucomicrobiota bacterium]